MPAPEHPLDLDSFPANARRTIIAALDDGPVVEAAQVAALTSELEIGVGDLMVALLPRAAEHARVPLSNFFVGAVALGATTGNLYLGSNMEFPGHALSASVHGEQSATNNAWLHGENGLRSIAVNEVPCGYCRQFLNELATPTGLEIIVARSSDASARAYSSNPLSYYLRDSFGPDDLAVAGRLMEPQSHALGVESDDPLVGSALDAANNSYSPYTRSFAGVAIRTQTDRTHVGRYAENAAFNPSFSPLQSALASLNMHEPPQSPYALTDAVLVENPDSPISQVSATRAVLASVAPDVELRVISAGSV